MLHTPLMSGTNAIHGIVLVGAILVAGRAGRRHADAGRRLRARSCSATANVVGGFVVTDRMLEMFKQRASRGRPRRMSRDRPPTCSTWSRSSASSSRSASSPRRSARARATARRGRDGARDRGHARPGRARATSAGSSSAMAIGAVVGVVGARSVKMTAMPQMVALFNGVGGGAVALIALAEFHNLAPARRARRRGVGRDPALGADRQHLLLRLADRVREAAGAAQRPADRLPGAAVRERCVAARRASALGVAIVAGAERDVFVVALIVAALAFGVLFVLPIGGADMPVVISLLNAFTGLAAVGRRLPAPQQRAHRRRRARRRLGHAADAADGPGDEPLDRERPLRRVRLGAAGAGAAAAARGRPQRALDHARGSRDHARATRARSSSSPATGSPSRRRSTTSAQLAELLEAKGVDVLYGSIPSPAACRGT